MRDEYNQFAQHFATVFAPEILTIYLQQVELFVSNQTWLSKKCQYQIFQFFTEWCVCFLYPPSLVNLILVVLNQNQLGLNSNLISRLSCLRLYSLS